MKDKNWLEWTVFAIGLALTLSVFSYLVYLGLHHGEQPPTFRVTVGAPEKVPDGYQMKVDVFNLGDVTAQNVQIEVAAGPQKGSFSIDFVPEHSAGTGWVVLPAPPQRAKGQVVGFTAP